MNKRDLKADLELCNKATPGPWRAGGSFVITFHDEWICEVVGEYSTDCEDNMRFVAQAREGWPHAIERAIKAEALARELMEALKKAHEYIGDINSFYGQGLQVYGWHLNGAPEPFDNFIDSNGGCEVEEFVGRVLTKAKEVLRND
jgi:hypothetical protein